MKLTIGLLLLCLLATGCGKTPDNPLHDTPTAHNYQTVLSDDEGFYRPTTPQGDPR